MLNDLGFFGTYKDDAMKVDIVFRNPLDYNLKADTMVFGILITPKKSGTFQLDDFRFYIMDRDNRLYNANNIPESSLEAITTEEMEKESPNTLRGFILTELKPEYLYQDIRIAFYHGNRFEVIVLEH